MKPELFLVVPIVLVGLFLALTKEFTQVTPLPHNAPSTPVVVVVPLPSATGVPIGGPTPATQPPSNLFDAIVAAARSWIGTPYLWGGCSHRGVDCSCFYMNVMSAVGVQVPRTTVTQIAAFAPIPRGEERIGDAVFFDNTCTDCGPNPTHVGMVIGNGLMIDAGDPVHIEPYTSGGWPSHNPRFGRPRGL